MKHYNSIDLLKFFMSFFVVAIHTDYDHTFFTGFICPLVVPMFFVLSGFLLQKKMSVYISCGNSNCVDWTINMYIVKLLKLYFLWTVLYLPLTFYGSCIIEGNSLVRAFAIFCRNVIFVGENYMSWPLWYLLALVWASFIVKILIKWKFTIEWILTCGLCFTIIGWGINNILQVEHMDGICGNFIYVYEKIFSTTRNGLFVGFGFVAVGLFLRKWQDFFSKHFAWAFFMTLVSAIVYLYGLPFSKHLLCFCTLLIVISIKLPDRNSFPWYRKMSTLIYFSHMFFVAILIHFFPEIHTGLPQFVLAAISAFVFSYIVIRLMEIPSFFFLKKLLG